MPSAAGKSKKKVASTAAKKGENEQPIPEPSPIPEAAVAPVPSSESSDIHTTPISAVIPGPSPAPPKKRASSSKKPIKVVAVVTPNGIEGSFTPEPRRPLIAHLHIKSSEVFFHDQVFRYDPNPPPVVDPQPYNPTETDFFLGGQEEILEKAQAQGLKEERKESKEENENEKKSEGVISDSQGKSSEQQSQQQQPSHANSPIKGMPCFTKSSLMVQFKSASESQRLPECTDIACFWCAHTFSWMPCIIPEREVNGIYQVYGNFCTPSCAVSYLLTEGIDPHVRWERMALLHRIYDSEGKGRIFPAPARESLQLFGGPMNIDVYRQTIHDKKVRIDLHMPPMVSILGSIDTKPIDFFDTNVKGGIGSSSLPLPQRSVEEGLRLKRTKPLKDRESTLDSVMNIRIGGR